MRALITSLVLIAGPAAAQEATLPSQAACDAIRDRVQIALAGADRALQAEDVVELERWTSAAASYAAVYDTFCPADEE